MRGGVCPPRVWESHGEVSSLSLCARVGGSFPPGAPPAAKAEAALTAACPEREGTGGRPRVCVHSCPWESSPLPCGAVSVLPPSPPAAPGGPGKSVSRPRVPLGRCVGPGSPGWPGPSPPGMGAAEWPQRRKQPPARQPPPAQRPVLTEPELEPLRCGLCTPRPGVRPRLVPLELHVATGGTFPFLELKMFSHRRF